MRRPNSRTAGLGRGRRARGSPSPRITPPLERRSSFRRSRPRLCSTHRRAVPRRARGRSSSSRRAGERRSPASGRGGSRAEAPPAHPTEGARGAASRRGTLRRHPRSSFPARRSAPAMELRAPALGAPARSNRRGTLPARRTDAGTEQG
jgi:hypothetical protein